MQTVTIIITAYNAAQFIKATLDSIEAQSYKDYDVIVVDDGSVDSTYAIARRHPVVSACIQKENTGQPDSRNAGIMATSSEYIAFVDADDLWSAEKLQLQMNALCSTGGMWACSGAYYFDDARNCIIGETSQVLPDGFVLSKLMMGNFIPSATVVVRREGLVSCGLFDAKSGNQHEDWNMWMRLAAAYPLTVVRDRLAYIRVRNNSTSKKWNTGKAYENALQIIDRAVASGKPGLDVVQARRNALENALLRAAQQGDSRSALRFALKTREFGISNVIGAAPFVAYSIMPESIRVRVRNARRREREIQDAHILHLLTQPVQSGR